MRERILSPIYKAARRFVIDRTYARQKRAGRSRDLEEAIETGDKILKNLPKSAYSFSIPDGMGIHVNGLYFPSPIILSSFKRDLDVVDRWLTLGFGGAITKTAMAQKDTGNSRPRIAEVFFENQTGFMNTVGLESDCAEDEALRLVSSKIWHHNRPIGISIGGNSLVEYQHVFKSMEEQMRPSRSRYFYEVNGSCPNTPRGREIGENLDLARELFASLRAYNPLVMIGLKVSPVSDHRIILDMARMLAQFAPVYINLSNSHPSRLAFMGLSPDALSSPVAGYSGPALYARTFELVRMVRKEVPAYDLPIIATGGVNSAKKIIELQDAGAQLFGVASALVSDMYCIPLINRDLARVLKQAR